MDHTDKPTAPTWELTEAITLIRMMQGVALRFGWNLSLGGGVLYNGYSFKDLDIVATPRQRGHEDKNGTEPIHQLAYHFQDLEYRGERVKWETGVCHEFKWQGRRIDILVFNVQPWLLPGV